MANGGFGNDFSKNNKIFSQQPSNQLSVNRSHFEAMNNLNVEFQNFKDVHERSIHQEMKLLKE